MPLTQIKTSNLDSSNSLLFRNRIINGDMRIHQRANASISVNDGGYFWAMDRTFGYGWASDGVFTLQQSTTAPVGFTNSLGITVTTADSSLTTNQEYGIRQNIEGYNTADFAWGTSSASTVTLSFWIRSSVAGIYSGSVCNNGYDRTYVFTYTINSANTWEYKSITIPGDTSGTWLTNNSIGIRLQFNLGAGPAKTGTSGSWGAGYIQNATGSTQLISTIGATMNITGLQLERGAAATDFERRPYGTELALCQRYYFKTKHIAGGNMPIQYSLFVQSSTIATGATIFPVTMRSKPTALEQSGTASDYAVFTSGGMLSCTAVPSFYDSSTDGALVTWTSSGMTSWQAGYGRSVTVGAYLAWSAEL